MGKRYKRMDHETMPQFNARCQVAELALKAPPKPKKVRVKRAANGKFAKAADKVDGFDRDNLGESPDF